MVKDVLDTLLLHVEFGDKLVTTPQGSLESHIDTCHYRVYPLLVQSGKADAGTQQKLMARMLQIMLIIGIIDDALQVAFIVAPSWEVHRYNSYLVLDYLLFDT